MNLRSVLVTPFTAVVIIVFAGSARGQSEISQHLAPFRPLIDKTWKGTFGSSTPEKPMHDVSRWDRVLNGQAIRILHSVNNGEYGGETIITWDPKKGSLVFYYFTTAGFFTNGTMELDGGKITSHEYVTGSEEGITEVKSTVEILSNGELHNKSKYLKNGKWVDGHEVIYVEDPSAQVIFK